MSPQQCPLCGAFIKTAATSCARCGATFDLSDLDDGYYCIDCGSAIEEGPGYCQSCRDGNTVTFSQELVHPGHGIWLHRARLGERVAEKHTFEPEMTEEEVRELLERLGPVSDREPEAPGA